MKVEIFGKTATDEEVHAIRLENENGYINDTVSMGATVGRVANRISNARFKLNNQEYILPANFGIHHLHGNHCLSKRVWKYETFCLQNAERVKLTTSSFDGEFGYPGDVDFAVTYTLNSKDQLIIQFKATNQSPVQTIVNMTNHSYFNLEESATIFEHTLKADCNAYLPVDNVGLVTGEKKELDGVFEGIPQGITFKNIVKSGIVDIDNDLIKRENNGALTLESPNSGLKMTITTTYPIFHIYCSQHFENIHGKNGKSYGKCCAVAIEPQKYSNAINLVSHISLKNLIHLPSHLIYYFCVFKFNL
ncbi:unnamed protein product [Enterobius vermicularis]|uniref:Galactose mutarotase n=1 Tax=Enterobius vermicularis TaxID=51028 RepID=A0A0N4V6H9_ENTVE|nr:unnamed protein product [Enterobius vermicularis]